MLVAAAVGALIGGFTDLSVYRFAGGAVLDGSAVYGPDDPATGLPFTYPPFAALALAPLAVLPEAVAAAVVTAATAGALAGSVALVLRELGRPGPGWQVAGLAAGSLSLEPVWQTLAFGQVNAVLMLVVLVDLLRPERRWSGVLLGLAAGVKLTPLGFVVLLLFVRRPAAAARAVATFAATVGVGLVLVADGPSYWDDRLLDPRRVGPPEFAGNQSLLGSLARLVDDVPGTWAWLAVALPVAAAGLGLAAYVWRGGDRVLGTCLAALALLLVSPMSWSHHWVWAVPLALALWDRSRVAAVAWVAVFVARPIWWPDGAESREYAWGAGQHLLGSGYVLAGLVLLAQMAWLARGQAVRGSAPV